MVQVNQTLLGAEYDDRTACQHWLDGLSAHYAPEDYQRLIAAGELLLECQAPALPIIGERHARQRLASADILLGLRMDAETLCAALLHGCLVDHRLSVDQISQRCGEVVARMVVALSRIGQLTEVERVVAVKDQPEHEENLRRLLLGVAEDVRVVLVVLADRLQLMRKIKHLEPAVQIKLAEDSQRVYAPLANRLGVWQIKWELEDLALRALEPEDYKRIAALLNERRIERQDYIARVISLLQTECERAGIDATISGRPKHLYSIWRKMQRKRVDIDRIFDLRALRVLVNDIPACYAVLGIVHGLWQHIPKEFDDYIATPKGNRYQSLHTAVIGPENKPLEVQIRTHDMHTHAEFGVAAHWAYKESKALDNDFQQRLVWMRRWLESNQEGAPLKDTPPLGGELQPAHVYVLTPQAKVIELPRGATPIDFAFAIHSAVGQRCRGALVDGRIVPLNYQLTSGETVEILTQNNATPSRDWINPQHGYLVTARARNRVRQWLKQQDFDQHLNDGRTLLEKELARYGITTVPALDPVAARYHLKRGEDVLAAIGRGDLTAAQVARPWVEDKKQPSEFINRVKPPPEKTTPNTQSAVIVEGVADLMTQMAPCCQPLPADQIVGFVTRGRGITVHRHDCQNILHLPEAERERLIAVRWAEAVPAAAHYSVDVIIIATDRKGLLRDVSSVFADHQTNVTGVRTHTDPRTEVATMHFTTQLQDLSQLQALMVRLRQLPDIHEVKRAR